MSEKEYLYRATLECIVNDDCRRVPCEIADDLLRFGWIKPAAESGVNSAAWIAEMREYIADSVDLTCYYVLTDEGLAILSPTANVEPVRLRLACNKPALKIPVVVEISRQERPNFDFSHKKGLYTCWGCFKPSRRANRRIRLILAAIAAKHKAPNFTVDGQQIMILTAFVEESRA